MLCVRISRPWGSVQPSPCSSTSSEVGSEGAQWQAGLANRSPTPTKTAKMATMSRIVSRFHPPADRLCGEVPVGGRDGQKVTKKEGERMVTDFFSYGRVKRASRIKSLVYGPLFRDEPFWPPPPVWAGFWGSRDSPPQTLGF